MAKFKPIDEDLRELVRNTHNRSFAVRAGAGTGKTTLLIGKILSLILNEGADIEKIVAITFTKKAAAELALRLRDQLERERRKLAEKGKLSGYAAMTLPSASQVSVCEPNFITPL
jgi:ATP-dependent helicase/nuclease subunit A